MSLSAGSAVLVINPGSTSTKLALFAAGEAADAGSSEPSGGFHLLAEVGLSHAAEVLCDFDGVAQQKDFRSAAVRAFLREQGFGGESDRRLAAVIGRGGLLAPLAGGIYAVDQGLLADLGSGEYGEHASNLGGIIADEIASEHGCPAFIADPVVVDELMDEARPSGMPEIQRRSIFHALNQKACARSVAAEIGKPYEDCNFIVAHMGGGVSVGAHRRGRVVDVNNALDGDGPFSPERCGGLPTGQLVAEVIRAFAEAREQAAFGGQVHKDIKKRLVGRGGLVAYLGLNDLRDVEAKIADGDEQADLVLRAMMHQISREIAGHGATLRGEIDGIILTGGMAHSKRVVDELSARLSWMGRIFLRPGEGEMEALADNAFAALAGTRPVQRYRNKA
jgi:butyrate kinase